MSKKRFAASLAAIAGLIVGLFFALSGGSAEASRSIVGSPDNPTFWGCINPSTNALVGSRFYVYDGTNTYPGCATWATKVHWSSGTNVPEQSQASVTAITTMNNRVDSGSHGNWAVDTITRTVTVTRHSAVEANKCGVGATNCWFYTAKLSDNGTFVTSVGANSPENGVAISGTVNGTIIGSENVEFYAPVGSIDNTPPASISGNDISTTDWVKQFFPVAAQAFIPTPNELDWSWVYNGINTCEQWVNSAAGNSGDIAGMNNCN